MPRPSIITRAALLAAALLAADLQAQRPGQAEARAEARADGSSSSTRTVTHRVVVVNGKTVVDERTVDGKPVGGAGRGAGAGAGGGPPPMPLHGDAERMLRELQERMRRELPGGFPGFPDPGREGGRAFDRKSDSRSARSSERRRVEVVNGEKVVDEHVRDGSSPPPAPTPVPAPAPRPDDGKLRDRGKRSGGDVPKVDPFDPARWGRPLEEKPKRR